jgi:hypothetical protein
LTSLGFTGEKKTLNELLWWEALFIFFLAIVLFTRTADDLLLYFIIQSTYILTLQCSLWLFLFKKVDFVKVSVKDAMSPFRLALEHFIGRVSVTFYTNLSSIILGLLGSITLVAFSHRQCYLSSE